MLLLEKSALHKPSVQSPDQALQKEVQALKQQQIQIQLSQRSTTDCILQEIQRIKEHFNESVDKHVQEHVDHILVKIQLESAQMTQRRDLMLAELKSFQEQMQCDIKEAKNKTFQQIAQEEVNKNQFIQSKIFSAINEARNIADEYNQKQVQACTSLDSKIAKVSDILLTKTAAADFEKLKQYIHKLATKNDIITCVSQIFTNKVVPLSDGIQKGLSSQASNLSHILKLLQQYDDSLANKASKQDLINFCASTNGQVGQIREEFQKQLRAYSEQLFD